MSDKPTYEELEQRVKDLEKSEPECQKAEEQKKLEVQLAKAMEMTQSGHWEYDIAKDCFTFNDQFYKIFRTTAAEIGGYQMSSSDYARRFVHPEDRYLVGKEISKAIKASDPGLYRQLEHRIIFPDGKRGYISVKFYIVKDAEGKTIRTYGVNQDITDRKRAEEAFENRMTALTSPLDDPGAITFQDLFNLNDIQRLQDQFAEATGVASLITNTDGTPITRPSNFCRLCNDIIRETEKGRINCYKSDAVLGKYCSEGSTIQPCLSGGLWDAGAGINVGGKHIANWLIGQVRDKTQTDEKMRAYAREIGADENQVVEAFHEVNSMSREQFEDISRMLFTLANQLSSAAYQNVQQARFISELRQAEIERGKLQDQLLQAQKMESVGRLAGGVAHDFNNMLSVILGNSEILMEDLGSNHQSFSNVREIQKAAERSANLTQQLLAFARKQTISPQKIDLNRIIEAMLKILRRLIGEDIDLSWKPKDALWSVKIDPSQVDQMLANLCVNARDAIKDVGKVTIETDNVHFDEGYCKAHQGFQPGDYVLIGISDNGCGMEKETIDNLFEPFFTTKKIGEGTGLGLATVYGIIKQNKGFINVYSEPGQGTVFKLYIPKHEDTRIKETVTVKERFQKGSETILLVEDDPSILKMTKVMLERLGYRVLAANTPDGAVKISKNSQIKIDLLMTDVVMPSMNGRELAQTILQAFPYMKCLYMSGYTSNVIAHRGILDAGLNFISKPFSKQALSIKLREILDE